MCSKCGQNYAHSSNLISHKRRAHGIKHTAAAGSISLGFIGLLLREWNAQIALSTTGGRAKGKKKKAAAKLCSSSTATSKHMQTRSSSSHYSTNNTQQQQIQKSAAGGGAKRQCFEARTVGSMQKMLNRTSIYYGMLYVCIWFVTIIILTNHFSPDTSGQVDDSMEHEDNKDDEMMDHSFSARAARKKPT